MAKLKSPLRVRWRGSVGALTGQQSRWGAIARRRFQTHIHQWSTRADYNSVMAGLLRSWRSMSIAERADWDQFGLDWPQTDRYGFTIVLSGFNWFVKLNSVTSWVFGTVNLTPPLDPVGSFNPSLGVLDLGAGSPVYLETVPTGVPVGSACLVKRLLNQPTSVRTFKTLQFFPMIVGFAPYLNVIASPSEMDSEIRSHFFQAVPIDSYGRKGDQIQIQINRGA